MDGLSASNCVYFSPEGCPSVAPSAEMPKPHTSLTMARVCALPPTACVHSVDYIHTYLTCRKQTVVLFKIKHLDDHRIDEQALV